MFRGILRSIKVSLWFMLLTLPILCIKVDSSVTPPALSWKPFNALYMGAAIFVLSFFWRGLMAKKGTLTPEEAGLEWFFQAMRRPFLKNMALGLMYISISAIPFLAEYYETGLVNRVGWLGWGALALGLLAALLTLAGQRPRASAVFHGAVAFVRENPAPRLGGIILVLAALAAFPQFASLYQTNVLTQALIWVMLGLGLNIVVGQAGLLVLGYMAFYAVGAYTYAIINHNFGVDFWVLLPLGGLAAAMAGLLLGFPVLRLKGDYLAIVTLGFGEIVNQVLKNWTEVTGGTQGIDSIPRPSVFGYSGLNMVYYIALAMAVLTIIAAGRLRDSRLGRSWMALREDEIACETMGIDKAKTKLTAFALGACWAGFAGVLVAAKNVTVNPASFTFLESATILCVVVLGGLGSIYGVVLGAFIIVLLPEYLRAFSEYRMLIFGASMVLLMVFRPQGLVAPRRKIWQINDPDIPATEANHD